MKSGIPTSARVSARKSSAVASSASCSWRRQRTRSSWLVDQSVSSNARRAAAIAASTSSAVASGAWPISAPVAGLRIGYVAPSLAGGQLAVDEQLRRGAVMPGSWVTYSPPRPAAARRVEGRSSGR